MLRHGLKTVSMPDWRVARRIAGRTPDCGACLELDPVNLAKVVRTMALTRHTGSDGEQTWLTAPKGVDGAERRESQPGGVCLLFVMETSGDVV